MDSNRGPEGHHRQFTISVVSPDGQRHDMSSNNAPANLPPYTGYSEERSNTLSPTAPLNQEGGNGSYATFRSLRRMTREALPRLDHYRNMASIVQANGSGRQRPTIEDLLNPTQDKEHLVTEDRDIVENLDNKFGWIKGVLVRVLLNIWGVILFLRISWVGGQAGLIEGIAIIMCGTAVTVLTTLSMSAISTNGQMKGGGTYFMISRSLGPEVGGAIGLMFSFANASAASMHIVGFCESLGDLLESLGAKIFDGGLNDIRLNACITIAVLITIVRIGLEWEARAQVFLLVVLVVAMLDFVIGAFIGPIDDEEFAKGFVGMNSTVLYNNLFSDYRQDKHTGVNMSFFNVFAVFFPACTGILAGANISGDLKDPSGAIPKGTLLAIFTTSSSYVIFIIMCCAATVRDATGNVTQIADWSFTNCTDMDCKWGLQNSAQVMELMSIFGPLIYAGCFAASLSSALTTLVSSFKIFQALCRDKLYPGIYFFAKGYGKTDEPYRAYALSVTVVVVFNLIARLDSIAPIITNFFMATYALINFSCFHASLQKSPGWRPAFKYYSPWLSLIGGVMCTAIMFFVSWWTALITVIIIILLCLYVKRRDPDANWGSSTQCSVYTAALDSAISLSNSNEHIKIYRPQVLVMSGAPNTRPPLIHFANALTKHMSLLVAGQCMPEAQSKRMRDYLTEESIHWLARHKIRGFYSLADGLPMGKASRVLMNNVGLGKLRTNMVLMGFKANWQTCPADELIGYFKVIQHSFDMHMAVGILRVEGGMDYSFVVDGLHKEYEATNNGASPINGSSGGSVATGSTGNIQAVSYQSSSSPSSGFKGAAQESSGGISGLLGKKKPPTEYRNKNGEIVPTHVIDNMLRFARKQPKGTIDVWWLFDDGGLTVLIPYILSTRRYWEDCSLRVFFLANKKDELAEEQMRMAELLRRFRIDFSDVVMVPDVTKPPREESIRDFNNLISNFVGNAGDGNEGQVITESELVALKEKTNRNIRIRELLLEHSRQASMIVLTLPVPVVGTVSAPLYMAWLETLTKDMPPFLLIRGNQTSVLTFYN